MILTIPGLSTRPPVEMLPSSPNSLSISTDNSKMNLDRNSSVDVRKTCSKSTIKATALTDIPRGTMSEDISVADMDELINTNHNVAVRVTKQGKMKASGCEDKRILEAKFADDCHSYNVLIQRGSADNMLILQTVIHIKAGDELLLWFSEEVAAALAIPFLTPLNIQGEKKYVCHLCDKQYEIPNPLKIHLALECGRFNRRHLWSRLANNSSAQKESENGHRIQCHILPMLSSLPPLSPLLGFKFELTPKGESDQKSEGTGPQDLSATSSHICEASSSCIDQIVTSQSNRSSKAIVTSGSLSVRESAFRPYLNKQPSFPNLKMAETEIKLRKPPVLDMLPNLRPSLLPHPHCIFHPPPQDNATMVKTTTAPEFLRRNTVTPSRLYPKETVRTSAFPFTQQCAEPSRTDFHHAAEMETLVSNLGRSKQGHLCIYCGKIYSRKYGLKIHIRTHTGYKPLKCKYCLRPFGDPSNLNKHVRLHAEGDTPYRCELCGKILVRRRDLERHLKSRHSPHPETEQDPEANKHQV